MSQLLAQRFENKCFTPLELTHSKDNFYSLALDQGGFRYWNEEILSRFLGIPDGAGEKVGRGIDRSLDSGPVIFRMVSYLGAFPFQNTLAPSVLTFEAMVKVIVLLTERYGRVLRRGKRDRIRLLFGSLADVARKQPSESEGNGENKTQPDEYDDLDGLDELDSHQSTNSRSHVAGFSVDQPANDEGDDDDDDLALAALESLDAIEVFKHDQRVDRTVYESRISIDTFRRLLALLVVLGPLRSLEETSEYFTGLDGGSTEAVVERVEHILSAFTTEEPDSGIGYATFARVISTSLPHLFDPLTPLFEHLLFSKNLNLSRKKVSQDGRATSPENTAPPSPPPSPPPSSALLSGSFDSNILDPALLSQISFFLSTTSSAPNFLHNGTRLHPVFSSAAHGESLTSFSHHVLTWQAPSLLILKGTRTDSDHQDSEIVTIGAYLPQAWKSYSSSSSGSPTSPTHRSSDLSKQPCLFQLSPKHVLLQANPSFNATKGNTPVASFSTKYGIALGCMIPPSSRTSKKADQTQPRPVGGGSLLIDPALENATLVISEGLNGEGVFLPPNISPNFPPRRSSLSSSISSAVAANSSNMSIYNLEVWGIVPPAAPANGSERPVDAITQQREHWSFEAREAERRKTIHLNVGGGDSEAQSGRALLEMAGIVGDSKYTARRPTA